MNINIDIKEIKILSDLVLFPSGYKNSHSYRIPTLLKLSSGRLITIVDQRIENAMDCPFATINQYIRWSDDNGLSWTEGYPIIKVEQFSKSRVSAIDSVSLEDKKTKTIFLMVDTFPGGAGIIRTTKDLNPIVPEGVGLTPDLKYQKFHQLNSELKYLLKPLVKKDANDNWLHAYQLKDGDWNNTSDNNLLATGIYVNNSYDPKTKILHGAVYENITDPFNIQTPPVCSIYDGFQNNDRNYVKPKYYIDSTAFIYGFKSDDGGLTWSLVGQLNAQVAPQTNIKAIVMGPGKGLQLKNQTNPKLNNRLILPAYTTEDYEIPGHFYTIYSDDGGKTWTTGGYPNPLGIDNWRWTSEGQMIEAQDGVVWAFLRQPEQNCYCLAKSVDGTATWQGIDDPQTTMTVYPWNNLNTVIMHGIANFVYKHQDYVFLSLPTTFDRKNGKLFLLNLNQPHQLHAIHHFGPDGATFGYSTIEILEQKDDEIIIGVLYEVSKNREKTLAWIGFDENENDYNHATEMVYQTLSIKL